MNNKSPKVFVVQDQFVRDQETGALISKFDFTKAKEFGQIEFLLDPNSHPFSPNQSIVQQLWKKLKHFSDVDYLLPTGNPVLIGWATALAAQANYGKVDMLQWNARRQCYLHIKSNLFEVIDVKSDIMELNGNVLCPLGSINHQ